MKIDRNRFIVPVKPKLNDSSNVTVIILASIPNERMKTMPAVSLMMIDKQHNVLDVQIESITATFPKSDIIIVVGHDANQIIEKKPKHLRVIENQRYEESGEIEELRLALNNCITDNVLLVHGSTIFNANAIRQLHGHGSATLIDRKNQIDENSLGVISNNSKVENIAYGIQDKWCHVTYLETKETNMLRKYVNGRGRSKLCFFESINYIVSHGGLIYTVGQSEGFLRKITSGKDLA